MIDSCARQLAALTIAFACFAGSARAATLISSPFSFGFGFTGANGGSWSTSETSSANTPSTQGLFTFTPAPTGARFSSDGVTFVDRVLANGTGGGGFSGYVTSSFAVPIAASYLGSAPPDVSGTPNYRLRVEISSISIYGGRHDASSSTPAMQWDETTAGQAQSSPSITLDTSNDFNEAAAYTQLSWNPEDYDVALGSLNDLVTRTFDIPVNGGSGDLRFVDGLEVQGVVHLIYDATPQTGAFRWQTNGLGDWNVGGNWDRGGSPSSNSVDVVFGQEATVATTVATNLAVTARSILFDNANSFVVGGLGSVTLDAEVGSAEINVISGVHQSQAVLNLETTNLSVGANASLAVNNQLHIGDSDVVKTGAGKLNLNNVLNSGTGTVYAMSGTVGGSGRVSGELVNDGAEVTPGIDVGQLSVGGDYVQTASGRLAIEIGGTAPSDYDRLSIAGEALLAGELTVSLVDLGGGTIVPQLNDSFAFLTAAGGRSGAFSIGDGALPPLDPGLAWELVYSANQVVLSVVSAGLRGDYNNNGIVDAADYTIWRNNPVSLQNEGASLGVVDIEDYKFWKAHFGETLESGGGSRVRIVPEACTLSLLLIGSFAILSGNRLVRRRDQF